MKKINLRLAKAASTLALMVTAGACFALSDSLAVGDLRMFSRANCATINESITWSPYGAISDMATIAMVTAPDGSAEYFNDANRGIRSRAGCYLCTAGGYTVTGSHYVYSSSDWRAADYYRYNRPCFHSYAYDCHLSEGWI